MDSSSASSPFSSRSTDPSSPEATTSGDGFPHKQNGHVPFIHASTDITHSMQGMHAMINSFSASYPTFTDFSLSRQSQDVKSFPGFGALTSSRAGASRNNDSVSAAAASVPGTAVSGSRSEPPKRQGEVDMLPVAVVSLDELAARADNNRLLLQGDPQVISKQRVETAIRVIIDLLRAIPATPTTPLPPPHLTSYLPRDLAGTIFTFERIGTFRALRLQAGATTKASSKKQLQAGPTPKDQLAYLETAVYMSGESGKRVYACKRCRMREARRRQNKDANRKKQSNSGSDTSSSNPKPSVSGVPPSIDYITGANPDQYDPHRASQLVEEPTWDPSRPDWRHEIVLFNSPPEVAIKDGSCMWLPFRVVCYGKCHGEKLGFIIKFTLRDFDGRIIASSTTDPIRITDDHKTDTKTKSLSNGAQAAVPRRKGRQSAASSRLQSPDPSEGESVQSVSEAGALMQKQTPHVRAGKPYERPPSQSPAIGVIPGGLPAEAPRFHRQHSSGSVHSVTSLPTMPVQDDQWSRASSTDFQDLVGTVSPNALRRPNFSFTALNESNQSTQFPASASQSAASSNVASPVAAFQPLNENALFLGDPTQSPVSLSSAFAGLNALNLQQSHSSAPMLFDSVDVDMSSALTSGFDGLFDTASQASFASSMGTSGVSGFLDNRSLASYSQSGLPPDSNMENFLDFSGGEEQNLAHPFPSAISPPGGAVIPPLPFDMDPLATHSPSAALQEMLASIAQPSPNAPVITHVIPAEGPVAGGITIAVAGQRFTPGVVIMFGGRVAKTTFVAEGFVQCTLPPAAEAGEVEVSVQDAIRLDAAQTFKYTGMDKEMMRLALEVRDQYQGSSSDAAYRLAQHIAASHSNSEWSDRSSTSPPGQSPMDKHTTGSDLQTAVINFLASIDENAPGSLRRSGTINHRNAAMQTLLHISTVMGFHRLVRRLIVIGAHLDLQDVNGFTPLAFASFCGQLACARVLIEAGAAYDRPTALGEMPLDLAKIGEREDVEALLLSAVWSTTPDAADGEASSTRSDAMESNSEIDDDNPSSDSDGEVSRVLRRRRSRKLQGKQKARDIILAAASARMSVSAISHDTAPHVTPSMTPGASDDPPPYEPESGGSWMSRTLSHTGLSHPHLKIAENVWGRLPIPSFWGPEKTDPSSQGWVAFPAPSWETLQKMASPEEVKLFTQAMAAAALNAMVQSTASTPAPTKSGHGKPGRNSRSGSFGGQAGQVGRKKSRQGSRSETESPSIQVVKHVKQDRMLYLFWLPILLFVGFWLLVTALPIATGFCLIYARQITRAIKQRM